MDFKQVNSAPTQAAPQPSPVRSSPPVNGGGQKGKPNVWLMVVGLLIVVALVGLGLWWALAGKNVGNGEAALNEDAYQAVFLTNGQVYFGKLKSTAGKYASMEDIYYLQVDQAVQPSVENPAEDADAADSSVQLIKLGNELHGPEDKMQISSAQILFWENLTDDSKISQAIEEYQD